MKKLVGIVAIVTVLMILGTCLIACNASTNSSVYKSRLEGKGYTVTNIDVTVVPRAMEWGLYAAKDGNIVTVALFKTEEDAKDAEQESKDNSYTTYRSGKLLIAGSEQGVKDARG